MATSEEEIRRGQGGDPTSPPLPQGAATQIAEAVVETPEALAEEPVEAEFEEDDDDLSDIEFADDLDEEDLATPNDDVSRYLYAPGMGIDSGQPGVSKRMGPVPRSVIRRIPILGAAASSPNSPPMVRALYRLIVDIARQDQDT